MPDLQEAFAEFKDQGVQFVGIQQLGIDSKAAGLAFLKEVGVEYSNIPDENSAIQLEYKNPFVSHDEFSWTETTTSSRSGTAS